MLSIIYGIIVAACVLVAYQMLGDDAELSEVAKLHWPTAVGIGATTGLINYFAPKLVEIQAVEWLFFLTMIGLFVWLMSWWHRDGSEWKEMVPFVILIIMFTMVTASVAWTLGASDFWSSVLLAVPTAMMIVSIGFIVIDFFYFRYRELKNVNKSGNHMAGIAGIVVATLLLLTLFGKSVAWSQFGQVVPEADASDAATEEKASDDWLHFYNPELLNDNDGDNDYNFGKNPLTSGWSAEDYDKELRRRMREDPALGAADMAWLDAIVGTRYLGEFYESCKGDWAKTINTSKETWMKDQTAYYDTLDAYFKFLDSAKKVEIKKVSGLDDQMYMNPYTKDSVPDVIVMETLDHEGTFLVYTFVIKGTTFEVAYRIECGYQPTNVEEVMDWTPEPQPTPGPGGSPGKGSDPEPGKGGGGPTPTPTPTPSKHPVKDPTQAPKKNTEPNDNKGPGAPAKAPENGTTKQNKQQYDNDVKEMKDIQNNQKTGNDNNKPSTPAPSSNTKVDNNGDKGTGNGGANTPTPTKEKAKEADTGKEINSSPGEAWGGPKD